MTQQWSTIQKDPSIVISNHGLTATATLSTTGVNIYGRDAGPAGAKMIYWELSVSETGTRSNSIGVGIGNAAGITSFPPGQLLGLGGDANSIGWYPDGTVSKSNVAFTNWSTWTESITPTLLCLALDVPNNTLYGRVGASGNWNNNPAANPATNTGGTVIPMLGPFFPALGLFDVGETGTAHFDPATWAGTAPVGFSAWPNVDGGMGILIALPVF